MVVILVLAADVDHPVDRARSAEHFAARLHHRPFDPLLARRRLVEPVDSRIDEVLSVADRNMNPRVPVLAAGLEQENLVLAGLGQAVGEDAAGTACANDYVVKSLFGHCFFSLREPWQRLGVP